VPHHGICPDLGSSLFSSNLEPPTSNLCFLRQRRKNTSLQVLCLPLLQTHCRVSFFPATLTQTPGCGCHAVSCFELIPLCVLRASVANPAFSVCCGLFISLCALFRTPILCFQSFADSFSKTPGVGGSAWPVTVPDRSVRSVTLWQISSFVPACKREAPAC